MKIYSVGIYARLSVDIEEKKRESIENQINLAKAFIRQQKDMLLCDIYTDVGKSGTHFKREGFERMMEDVRNRKINCILVKDLSRFGRNHIEVGNYLEKIFPFLEVRFVSITEKFDNLHMSAKEEMFHMQLKNLINEMYAKDIAQKVKSSKKIKSLDGNFTGSVAPYGYKIKRIGNKRYLEADENTSKIVKEIYQKFLEGHKRKEIALWLYEQKILRPKEYHKTREICAKDNTLMRWSDKTISAILKNPIYTGSIYSEKIIEQDIFLQIQEKMAPFEKEKKREMACIPMEKDILDGILFCGECHRKLNRISMIKKRNSESSYRSYVYDCQRKDTFKKCLEIALEYDVLEKIVKTITKQMLKENGISKEKMLNLYWKERKKQEKHWQAEFLKQKGKIDEQSRRESRLYCQYRMGKMSQEILQMHLQETKQKKQYYKVKIESIKKQIESLTKKEEFMNREGIDFFLKNSFLDVIEKIEVYREKKIKVIFAFSKKEFCE